MNKERLQSLARDVRKTPPHNPRKTLAGFVIAARMLAKAGARVRNLTERAVNNQITNQKRT